MMNISVIICTYTEKRWDILVDAITSVQEQSTPAYEIIAVSDNNHALAERLQARFPTITVVENTGPRGLSAARNTGIAAATGDILAFIDDDAVADKNWLSYLAQGYEDQRVLGVGGLVVPEWVNERPQWFPEEFNWVVGCSYRGLPLKTCSIRNFIGCNMSFRRDVFSVIEGFDSGLGRVGTHPGGCEETEMCIRINQQWPEAILLYEPRSVVKQIIAAERKNWRYFLSRCFFEGRSKAYMARFVGTEKGLSSERNYTLQTLPSGVYTGVVETFLRRNVYGILRASAIIIGLCSTTLGYLIARTEQRSIKLALSH